MTDFSKSVFLFLYKKRSGFSGRLSVYFCNREKLISNMRRRNPEAGLVVFWVKLRQRSDNRACMNKT